MRGLENENNDKHDINTTPGLTKMELYTVNILPKAHPGVFPKCDHLWNTMMYSWEKWCVTNLTSPHRVSAVSSRLLKTLSSERRAQHRDKHRCHHHHHYQAQSLDNIVKRGKFFYDNLFIQTYQHCFNSNISTLFSLVINIVRIEKAGQCYSLCLFGAIAILHLLILSYIYILILSYIYMHLLKFAGRIQGA